MPMTMRSTDFVAVIATCLAFPHAPAPQLITLVAKVLAMATPQDRTALDQLQQEIAATPDAKNPIALVYGGATNIKGYVFEAPKLPEIRGASALLNWVNVQGVAQIWHRHLGGQLHDPALVEQCIIYASGGSFLAFAPAVLAQDMATAVERCYTEQTLTANSAAVQHSFGLLELRFGRGPLHYWVENFLTDCQNDERREVLLQYYYPPEGIDSAATDDEALRRRFLNRKSFGELVTVLATMFNRRRDERASHGEPRSLPHFELNPWALKCQSSDVRPAIVAARVGSDSRVLSEPSARKLAAGRAVKGARVGDQLEETLEPWTVPADLEARSWEQRWEQFLASAVASETRYAKALGERKAEPASDVGEIGEDSCRYIGLIYADGNDIGRLMATLDSTTIYQQVSQALTDVAQHAVFSALAEHLQPISVYNKQQARNVLVHPFEILAIGGDDLFIVVPGNRAFDIALSVARSFEQELTKRFADLGLAMGSATTLNGRYAGSNPEARALRLSVPTVGLSAGVLIAQENAPFFFLRDLVEQLLKQAKQLAKGHAAALDKDKQPKPRYFGGAVDFMVLKSTTMVTDKIGAFRDAALNDHKESKRRLTARPYTWAEFAGLLATTRALRQADFPRSQLYRLCRTLDYDHGEGVLSSVMEYLYTRLRQKDPVAGALMEHVEHAWCLGNLGSSGRVGMPPWSPLPEAGYETIWPDLVEAWEFVAGTEA